MDASEIFNLNNYFFNVYAIPNFAIAVILAVFGLFVWLKNRRAKLNISFILMTIPLVGWFLAYAVVYSAKSADVAFFWNKIVYLFVPFLAPGIFFFTAVLLERERRYKKMIVASLVLMSFFPVFAFLHPEFLKGIKLYWWGYYAYYGWLGYVFIGFFVFFSLLMYFILLPAYSKLETKLKKKQAFLLIISLAFAYTALGDFAAKFGYSLYPYGYISFSFFVIINAYAILRYKVFSFTPQIASQEIINTMSDSLILINKERKVEYANPAALEMFGYSEREIIGKPMEELVVKSSAYLKGWRRLMTGETLSDDSAEFLRKDKTKIPVKQSLAGIKDETGEFLGVLCLATDMTEFRNLISELIWKTEELEKSKGALEAKEKELQEKLFMLENFRKMVSGGNGGK